jgi:hypothetical protein
MPCIEHDSGGPRCGGGLPKTSPLEARKRPQSAGPFPFLGTKLPEWRNLGVRRRT